MEISDTTAFVTGANRGLGRHITEQLLERGAARVYAAARDVSSLEALADDARVTAVALDVTDPEAVRSAAAEADDVDLLVNNAGVLSFGDPLDSGSDDWRRDFEVNVIGPLRLTQAFAPTLARRGGAVANVVTLIALAPVVGMAPYCASKAALHSLTQAQRAALAAQGVTVHGFYPAGIDTDMLAAVDGPKEPPSAVARALLDGIEADQAVIHPDGAAEPMALYAQDPHALERALTAA